jgi:H+/Na+-translocating ferredoxin:NAD+ oxidoreductase subunit B
MHTVIAGACTGCKLCVAPCPVDCILMVSASPAQADQETWPEYTPAEVDAWRNRAAARNARLARAGAKGLRAKRSPRARETLARAAPPAKMRDEIRAAVERAKRKRAAEAKRRTT